MRKAKEVERFRSPFSTPLAVQDRKWSELQQACFLGMQFEVELPHSFRQFRPEPLGIRSFLESNYDVVSKPHDDDIATGMFPTPRLNPQVKYVMKIDVGQQRRCTATLGRSFFYPYPLPFLQHAGVQPFLDEPHNASVRDSVLDEPHQPFVGNFVVGRDGS
jgi:hypothetical protein